MLSDFIIRKYLKFQYILKYVFSGFRREVGEICAPLENYATYDGNFLPAFPANLWDGKFVPKRR